MAPPTRSRGQAADRGSVEATHTERRIRRMEHERTLQDALRAFHREKYPDKTDQDIEEMYLEKIKDAARHGDDEAAAWLFAHGVEIAGEKVVLEIRGYLVDDVRSTVTKNGGLESDRRTLVFDLDDDGSLYRLVVGEPSHAIAEYIGGLTIGQGRYAGEPFRLLGWQRRFLRVFNGPGDGAMSLARGGHNTERVR